MNEIKDKSVQVFIDELASKASTPGGGSAAAVMGAQAAALVSMVCNLTIGKPGYTEVEEEMRALLAQSEALREQLMSFIQADVDVFDCLMATYRLPKDSEQDKASRSVAIQAALQEATLVPLACAKACAEIIALSRTAAYKGNLGAISDAGVAVMAAYGGLKSAALNVYINTAGLKNKLFVEEKLAELEKIMNGADLATDEIYQLVKARL